MTKNTFVNILIEIGILSVLLGLIYLFHINIFQDVADELEFDFWFASLADKYHLPLFWLGWFLTFYFRNFIFKMKSNWINTGMILSFFPAVFYLIVWLNFNYQFGDHGYTIYPPLSALPEVFLPDELPFKFKVITWIGASFIFLVPVIIWRKNIKIEG